MVEHPPDDSDMDDDEILMDLNFPCGLSSGDCLRPFLAAIPYVGGSLATAWADFDSRRRFDHIEDVLQRIAIRMHRLGAVLNPERIGDDEIQVFAEVARRVQVEFREKKRAQFAELLISLWRTGSSVSFDEKMQFVRALDEFSDIHMAILSLLKAAKKIGRTPSFDEIGEELHISEVCRSEILIPALDRLATGFGFVHRAWGLSSEKRSLLSTKNLSPEGIARGCDHAITEIGERFLNSITVFENT